MTAVSRILGRSDLSRGDIVALLSATAEDDIEAIRAKAEDVLLRNGSDIVYRRGLIEFSNRCSMDCHYCGIRRGNAAVQRYDLTADQILDAARWCAAQGYGSVVLQSGERRDAEFVGFVERIVRLVKENTRSERLPAGLGITLCVGEQSPETYRRFFAAGAHRYLLRIETSNRELFAAIHPKGQTIDARIACLRSLREAGFQVGTGVMIGLPGQTFEMLADDVLFFRDMDIDMIGMGPYIPHPATPLGKDRVADGAAALRLGLLMIAACRIVLRDVNIAATTALQALDPQGRERGLRFGANILMPQLTPLERRADYLLYPGKPCVGEDRDECSECLAARIASVGRRFGVDQWGDSRHVRRNSVLANG